MCTYTIDSLNPTNQRPIGGRTSCPPPISIEYEYKLFNSIFLSCFFLSSYTTLCLSYCIQIQRLHPCTLSHCIMTWTWPSDPNARNLLFTLHHCRVYLGESQDLLLRVSMTSLPRWLVYLASSSTSLLTRSQVSPRLLLSLCFLTINCVSITLFLVRFLLLPPTSSPSQHSIVAPIDTCFHGFMSTLSRFNDDDDDDEIRWHSYHCLFPQMLCDLYFTHISFD